MMNIRDAAIEAKNRAREWATEKANLWADVAEWAKNGSEIESDAKAWADSWAEAANVTTSDAEKFCIGGISESVTARLSGLDQDEIDELARLSAWAVARSARSNLKTPA